MISILSTEAGMSLGWMFSSACSADRMSSARLEALEDARTCSSSSDRINNSRKLSCGVLCLRRDCTISSVHILRTVSRSMYFVGLLGRCALIWRGPDATMTLSCVTVAFTKNTASLMLSDPYRGTFVQALIILGGGEEFAGRRGRLGWIWTVEWSCCVPAWVTAGVRGAVAGSGGGEGMLEAIFGPERSRGDWRCEKCSANVVHALFSIFNYCIY